MFFHPKPHFPTSFPRSIKRFISCIIIKRIKTPFSWIEYTIIWKRKHLLVFPFYFQEIFFWGWIVSFGKDISILEFKKSSLGLIICLPLYFSSSMFYTFPSFWLHAWFATNYELPAAPVSGTATFFFRKVYDIACQGELNQLFDYVIAVSW